MQLLEAWKSSMALFKPKNFKLFMLVTLKATIDTYRVWFTYWGWIFALCVLVFWVDGAIAQSILVSDLAFGIGLPLLFFTLCLSVRPSVYLKNFGYFTQYLKHLFHFSIWAILFMATNYAVGFEFSLLSFFFIFSVLFLLDSDGSIKASLYSLFRGLKMVWFNIPFCVITIVVFKMFTFVLLFIVNLVFSNQLMTDEIVMLGVMAILPLPISFITNFYTKKVHDQFGLYE